MIVGHLPMENSRVTKYILDRGARVYAIVTSTNYCVSPLVQGGLQIPCRVEIHMPATVKTKELMKIYETYVDTLYYQRKETHIARSSIDGGSEVEKNDKDHLKKTQSKQRKDEDVNGTLSRNRTFFEKSF